MAKSDDRRFFVWLCVAAVVAVATVGCRNPTEPLPNVAGSWAGEVRGISFQFTVARTDTVCVPNLFSGGYCSSTDDLFAGHGTFANANAGLSFPVVAGTQLSREPLPRYIELAFNEDVSGPVRGYAVFRGDMTNRNTISGRIVTSTLSGSVPPAPFGFDTATITFHRTR